MTLRKAIAGLTSLALAAQPVLADEGFYFRNTTSVPLYAGTPEAPPNTAPNSEVGTGALRVYAPGSVRARPAVAFRLPVTVANPTGGVLWTVMSGTLPAGLSLDQDGVISGFPSSPGSSSVVVQAQDSSGATGQTRPVAISVSGAPSVTMASATVDAGKPVSLQGQSAGTFGTVTWSLSGTLPIGLALDARTGAITGSTVQGGTIGGLVATVTDADGATGSSAPFSIAVRSKISVTGLLSRYPIRVGGAFSGVRPGVTGNDHPVNWTLGTGALPDGMSFDPGTGALTGVPSAPGTYGPLALQATDPVSGDTVVSPSFVVVLAPAPTVTVDAFYGTRTMGGVTVKPATTGLLGGGRWFLDNAAPPPGFQFDQDQGILSGSYPQMRASTASNLQLRVIDLFDGAQASSSPFKVQVLEEVGIVAPSLPAGTVGEPYRVPAPQAQHVVGTPTWSVSGLPTGTRFDPATGAVSGTPTVAGNYWVGYSVVDSYDKASPRTGFVPQTVVISPKGTPVALAIRDLPATNTAISGAPFSLAPTSQGLKGIGSWAASALPQWAGFDSASGTISGMPSAPDSTPDIVLSLTDSSTGETVTSKPFTVSARNTVTASYPGLTQVLQGADVSIVPSLADAVGTPSFALSGGQLPAGLSFSAATGAITGRTYDAGDANGLTVTVSDTGTTGFAPPFRISVGATAWQVSLPSDTTVLAGTGATLTPTATGFPVAPRWTLAEGSLPTGATLNANSGAITLTNPQAGVSTGLRLQAEDAQGHRARSRAFDVTVVAQRNLSASLPPSATGIVGTPLTVNATATGAQPPVQWAVASGAKPDWLALDKASGAMTGTPTGAGSWTFGLAATDASGLHASTGQLTLTVTDPHLTLSGIPGAIQAPYKTAFASPSVSVTGATGNPTFTLASGTLPAGLSISPSTGAVSGSATELGLFQGLSVRATDANGTTQVSDAFSVTVARPVLTATGPSGTLAATVGKAMATAAPVAKGAVGTVRWAANGLPAWLTLSDPATGVLRGTPPSEGVAGPVTLVATDAYDGATVTVPGFTVNATVPATNPDGSVAAAVAYSNARYVARVGIPFTSGVPGVSGLGTVTGWIASASLPAGLALNASTGEISGTPTSPSTTSLSTVATDGTGKTATSPSIVVAVAAQPRLVPPSLAPRANAPFTAAATATGIVGTPVFSLSANAPSWLRLDPSTGTISSEKGGPAGTYPSLVMKVTDADGASANASFALTVAPGIAVGGLAQSYPGRIGKPLAPVTPTVSGAKGAVSWRSANGAFLPAGLTLAANTGTLSGTPGSGGTVTFEAVDAFDGATASAATTLSLAQPLALQGDLSITVHEGTDASTPAPAIVGQRGGSMGFALTAGSLPSFARFQSDTGTVLLRSPTPGTSTGLAITATDPVDQAQATSQPFSVTVVPTPIVDGIATSYVAQYGKAFSIAAPRLLNAIGAATWTVQGQLPTWAYQAPDGGIVGTLPDRFGSTDLTIVGTDASKASASSPRFTLSVVSRPEISLSVPVAKGRLGAPIRVTAGTNGTAATPVWTYVAEQGSGSLPTGVTFDATTASVGGTATGTGSASFHFHVEDTTGQASANSQPVSLTVAPTLSLAMSDGPTPSYTTRITTSFASGKAVPTGLAGTATYALSPAAPGGMSAFPSGGQVLTGIPSAPFGRTTFTATVTDGFDGKTASTSFTLAALGAVAVNGTQDVLVRTGAAIDAVAFTPTPVNMTDATKAAWSLASGSSPLPAGITVSPTTGKLTGTSSATGAFPGLSLSVKDADGTSGTNAVPFSVTVQPALKVTAQTLAYNARYGLQIKSAPVTPAGNIGALSYSLVTKTGTAPTPAPTVGSDGSLTFTPDANTSATWTYVVRGRDTDGATADSDVVTVSTGATPTVSFPTATVQVYSTSVQTVVPQISNTSGATTITWNAAPATWIQQTPTATTGAVVVNPVGIAAGTYPSASTTYKLNVKDATNQIGSGTVAVKVVANTFAVTAPASAATLTWHVGSPFAYQATATGTTGTTAWTRASPVTGTAGSGPANLTVAANGAIGLNQASTLTATAATAYLYDSASGQYAPFSFNAAVIPALGMTLSATSSTEAEGATITAVTPTITSGTSVGTVTYSLSGAPTGVVASSTTGQITGAPANGTASATPYSVTLTATDAAGGSVSKVLAMTVNPGPALTWSQAATFTQDGYPGTTCVPVGLTNAGQGPAAGVAFALSSTADFQSCSSGITTPCTAGMGLAPGASCNYGVVLNSGSKGQKTVTLTATPTKGSVGTATLVGNPNLTVEAGAYLFGTGTGQTFALPAAGLNVRMLLVGGGASGSTTTSASNSYQIPGRGGSSGMLTYVAVASAPATLTYTIATGAASGTAGSNNSGNTGGTTTVTVNGTTYSAAGGTSSGGGSGGSVGAAWGAAGGLSGPNGGGSGQGSGVAPWNALANFRKATVTAGAGGRYPYGTSGFGHIGGCGGGGVYFAGVSFAAGQPTATTSAGGGGSNDQPCSSGGEGFGGGGSSAGTNPNYPYNSNASGGGAPGALLVEWDAR